MKQIKKTLALLLAVLMIAALSPVAFADGDSNVIFAITDNTTPLGGGTPWAGNVGNAEGVTTVPYGYISEMGTTSKYADASESYEALCFMSLGNEEEYGAQVSSDVYIGIDFGEDPSIIEPEKAFLTFDFLRTSKCEHATISVGAMYKDNNEEWVKRDPVNLTKYTSIAMETWKNLAFPLSDLGLTASDYAFEGLYFKFDNITLPENNVLWDMLAKAFNMAIVDSIGEIDINNITPAAGEEVELANSDGHLVVQAKLAANSSEYLSLESASGFTAKGVTPATKNFPAYYVLPMRKPVAGYGYEYFSDHVSGNIENYDLVLTFQRGVGAVEPIKDFEFGVGNAGGLSGYTSLPFAMRTMPVADFGYTGAASGTQYTVNVGSIKNILDNGNYKEVVPSGKTVNALTSENINTFVMKVTTGANYGGAGNLVKFTSIKLVSHAIDLINTTPAGGNISWEAPSAAPICYKVFEEDGTWLCDTTDTTVDGTIGNVYRVYAYYGEGVYSNELVIEPEEPPTPASIDEFGTDLIFTLGDNDSTTAVAIVAEYNANNVLTNVTIEPFGYRSELPIPKPSGKFKAFIFDSFDNLLPLADSFVSPAQ